MLRTHRAGKGPGGCGGRGLGSRNRRGPGVPPTPGLRGQGTSPGSPAAFLGSSGGRQTPSSPLLLLQSGRAPPAYLSCPPQPPSYARWTHAAWRGLWRAGHRPGSSAGSLARVGGAITLLSSSAPPGWLLPLASPDLPGLRGTEPVWPPLFLPPQCPYFLPVHFGVPPVSLGIRVPHQRPTYSLL